VILAGIALAVYSNTLAVPFLFDDHSAIIESAELRHPWESWKQILLGVRPVVTATLAANFAVEGVGSTYWYHVFNITVHILAGLTLYGLVRRTLLLPHFKGRFDKSATGTALAAALLWTVHPLQVESVTYIVQRAESLMGLFYLSTFYCFVRGSQSEKRQGCWYAVAVLAAALGMGTKEVMATAPFLLLLYDRVFLAGSFKEALRRRWGFYGALVASLVILIAPLRYAFATEEGSSGGAGFGLQKVSAKEYALSQPGVVVHYLRLSFWPMPLCLDLDWPVTRQVTAASIPPLAILGVLLGATIWALIRWPAMGFLGAAFFLILAPTSSIMPILDLAVEHRMYLPLAPLTVAVVVIAKMGLELVLGPRFLALPHPRGIALGLLVLVVLQLALWTYKRNSIYRSALAIWGDVVAQRPDNARAHSNYGMALRDAGRLEQARDQFVMALKLKTDYAEAENNLAVVYQEQGRLVDSKRLFEKVLATNPAYAEAHYNFGNTLARLGEEELAVQEYQRCLELRPDSAMALDNMGTALSAIGELEKAAVAYEKALALAPKYLLAHNNLGCLLLQMGKLDLAASHLEAALQLDQRSAHARLYLGVTRFLEGRPAEALALIQQAVSLQPRAGQYRFCLAHVLMATGQADRARQVYTQARQLDSAWPSEANFLAWRLATNRDLQDRGMALFLAQQICEASDYGDWDYLDTLAAVYARQGDFARARELAKKAVGLISDSQHSQQSQAIAARLQQYEQGHPHDTEVRQKTKWDEGS
jgi:Flp pilus assembly protein TadD